MFPNDCLSNKDSAMRALYKSKYPQNSECLENNIFLSLIQSGELSPLYFYI